MKVFKFGGASIKDAVSIQNVVNILKKYQENNPLVVISASGKTTNALEIVANAYYGGNISQAFEALETVKNHHYSIMEELFPDKDHDIYAEISDMFVDVEWILEENPVGGFDQIYDQIVSLGELLSSKIVAAYLNEAGMKAHWLDVRDCILTDNNYRDANIEWEETERKIKKNVSDLKGQGFIITQGFLGITSENFTTTLGREGSDYSAAIFSFCLDATSMTIWKDVPGVLNADPRLFKDATLLEKISYSEAIEMTYYGAQVIHPKTLRPLQRKNIPLYVKSFIHPENEGTIVFDKEPEFYPPVMVVKQNQELLNFYSKSFYFVDEARFSRLFDAFARHRIKVNMTQNTALAFSVCVNADRKKIETLTEELTQEYHIESVSDLKLLTVRHSNESMIERLVKGKKIYLEERIKGTVQMLLNSDEILQ
jgi:aspartate kinase